MKYLFLVLLFAAGCSSATHGNFQVMREATVRCIKMDDGSTVDLTLRRGTVIDVLAERETEGLIAHR